MATISAVIKWTSNTDELRRELAAGADQLVVLEKAAERTSRNLGGEGLLRAAHNAAAAVQQLGGVTKLTSSEQDKINSLMERAIAKYDALGQRAPSALRQLADATKASAAATSSLDDHLQQIQKHVNAFSGTKIIQEAHQLARAVQEVGGADKLTAAEQAKVNALVTEAIAKYQRLGKEAPDALHALQAQTSQLVHTVQPLPAHLNKITESKATGYFNDLTTQVKATALGFIGAQAVIGGIQTAFHTLSDFLQDSVKSFAAAEAAQKKLTTALQASGNATPQVLKQFDEMASSFQRTTVYSDDLINEMQALLTQVGNVLPSQMERALKASTDLASGLGIDLRTATLLVGKAFEGETGTLKRYGIVIDEAKLKTEGATAVLDAIQQKFGGQAGAEIETYAGKVKQLANEWDNLKEAVGKNIVGNPVLIAAMRLATEEARKHGEATADTNAELRRALQPFGLIGFAYLKIAEAAKAANAEAANFARAIANTPKMPEFGKPRPAQFGLDLPNTKEIIDEWTEADKKAKEAAEQHAKAVRELADAFSGLKAITAANTALEAYVANERRGLDVTKMTDEQVLSLNKTLESAVDVYTRWGDAVPPRLQRVHDQTQRLVVAQDAAKLSLEEWNETIRQHTTDQKAGEDATLEAIEAAERQRFDDAKAALEEWDATVKRHNDEQKAGEAATLGMLEDRAKAAIAHERSIQQGLDDIGRSLAQLGGAFNNLFGVILSGAAAAVTGLRDVRSSIGDLKQGLSDFKTDAIGGIFGVVSGILGIVSAATQAGKAIANLLDRNKGRDAVIDFATNITGSSDLNKFHEFLQQKLPQDAERFWIALTQGVGRNNPEQARKIIEEITAALGKATGPVSFAEQAEQAGFQTREALRKVADDAIKLWEFMRDSGEYSAEAVQHAWERAQAALVAAGDQTAVAVQKTHDEIKKLDDEMKSLTDSIANEAPEEEMGVVERQTRDRIEQLAAQRKLLEEQLQAASDETANSAAEAGATVDEELGGAIHRTGELIDLNKGAWRGWADNAISEAERVAKALGSLSFPTPTGEAPEPADAASTGGYVVPTGIVPTYARGGVVEAEHFDTGGLVRFMPKGTDSVPAMLTPKEGVVTVQGMELLGTQGLAQLNHGIAPTILPSTSQMTSAQPQAVSVVIRNAFHLSGVDGPSIQRMVASRDFTEELERQLSRNVNGLATAVRQVRT